MNNIDAKSLILTATLVLQVVAGVFGVTSFDAVATERAGDVAKYEARISALEATIGRMVMERWERDNAPPKPRRARHAKD